MLLEEYSKLDVGKMFQYSVPGLVQQCIHVYVSVCGSRTQRNAWFDSEYMFMYPRMHLEEFGFFVKVVSDLEAGVQHSR